jgi:hypothetical protein
MKEKEKDTKIALEKAKRDQRAAQQEDAMHYFSSLVKVRAAFFA